MSSGVEVRNREGAPDGWWFPRRTGGYLEGASGPNRLVGIDAARGLALLGMIAAHVGVTTEGFDSLEGWLSLSQGRSSVLFAVVAGFSVGIISGRLTPHTGERLVRTRMRLLVRSVLLLAVGAFLHLLDTPILVILGFYATWFVLAIPFLAWRARSLLVLAGVVAVAGPVAKFYLPPLLALVGWDVYTIGDDPNGALIGFLLTGAYPGVVWMAYIFLGLGLARIGWAPLGRVLILLGAGVALTTAGYAGGPWLIGPAGTDVTEAVALGGGWPDPVILLVTEPHTDSIAEVMGAAGAALVVIAAGLLIARRAAWVLAPLAATGSMSLTIYTAHVVWVSVLGSDVVWEPSNANLLMMVLALTGFAMLWKLVFARGPLEHWVHVASVKATRAAGQPAATGLG
ncbi:MAG TPA: DUF1624 domain-containing protein [Actinomycetales bacterium]|nr:DUF1624 domain-containing protein [Actinomycetales bacterium]